MKRALITGVTGFVGSHLAEYLAREGSGYTVYGLTRWLDPVEYVAALLARGGLTLVEGDITDLG